MNRSTAREGLLEQMTAPPSPQRLRDLRFVASEAAVWAGLYGAYLMIRSLAIDGSGDAFVHAGWLIDIERATGLLHEARLQDAVGSVDALPAFFDLYYMIGFGPLLAASLVWLGIRRRDAYRELRTALLASLVLAALFFVLFPTAPPRLVSDLGIVDTVGLSGGHDTGSFAGIRFNPYAAMPSMHVGWSLLLALVAWRAARRSLPRVLIALHPVVMTLTVVATGNHFFVDAAGGVIVALAGYALVSCRSARLLPRVRGARALRLAWGRCPATPGA